MTKRRAARSNDPRTLQAAAALMVVAIAALLGTIWSLGPGESADPVGSLLRLLTPASALAPPSFQVLVRSPYDGMTVTGDAAFCALEVQVSSENLPKLTRHVERICVVVDDAPAVNAGLCKPLDAEDVIRVPLPASGAHKLRGVAVNKAGEEVGRRGPSVRVLRMGSPPPPSDFAAVAPAPGTLVYEGAEGVKLDVLLSLVYDEVPPDSAMAVTVPDEGTTVLPADSEFSLFFRDYGTFAADIAITRWGGQDVAQPQPSTWVMFDTQAEDVGCGREPAGWRGLAAQLGSFSVPAMTKLLYVGDVGAHMDGQKQIFLQQFRLLPSSRYSITLVDLMCRPEEELGHAYIRDAEAAGVRIVKLCLLFPPGITNSEQMVQALEVLHGIERWGDVPAEIQTMMVELYLTMRGQDVMMVGNSVEVDVGHLVQIARLAQVPVRVVDMGGWGPKTPVNPHSVTAFLGSSHFVTQHPALLAHGVPSYVVNPYVDVSQFSPPLSPLAPSDLGRITLGMLGRLSREKNPALFVSMAALLDPQRYRFVVLGDGPLRPSLERYAAHLGVQLEFQGFVAHAELPQRLQELDLLVCPILQHDTFTISNIEAMATGVPVAGFAYGGMRGYMRHGVNSLVTSDFSARGLAALVSGPGTDREGLRRLGLSAREFVVERYDAESTSMNYEAFYALIAG